MSLPRVLRGLKHHGNGPEHKYFNREISWLCFNKHVLDEAICRTTEPLERIKFIDIFCRNLDEFFMVRVAGLRRSLLEELASTDSPDQTPPSQIKQAISRYTKKLIKKLYDKTFNFVLPDLERFNIFIARYSDLSAADQIGLEQYFNQFIYPVLTPLAVDPAHPFPFLSNLRLYVLVVFDAGDEFQTPPIAFVEIPEVLPRLVPIQVGNGTFKYIMLEDVIAQHLDSLFLATMRAL